MLFDKPIRLEDCCLHFAAHCSGAGNIPDFLPSFKLFSVTRSSARLRTANGQYSVSEGDCFICMPYEIFGISDDSAVPVELDCVYFTAEAARFGSLLSDMKVSGVVTAKRIFSDKGVSRTLKSVVDELDEDKAFSKEIINHLSSQLMLYVMRRFCPVNDGAKEKVDSYADLCSKIKGNIDADVFGIKSLSEVAEMLGYNYSYISNVFRKTTGMTLNSYFLAKKMEQAQLLLKTTGKSVSQIAALLNYSSVYAFSKAFKTFTGESPASFRKRMQIR